MAVRRVRKVGNFRTFAVSISREADQRRLIDSHLSVFGKTVSAFDGKPYRAGQAVF